MNLLIVMMTMKMAGIVSDEDNESDGVVPRIMRVMGIMRSIIKMIEIVMMTINIDLNYLRDLALRL
jgi:hypothetical protein